ncbi:MAG: Trifunctional nucleotide phosphoesterase protein YfkN precursor [Syntrophus sp. PtaU1.Bin208]|nr:MAG: Trifunctional nucleotide phosphoesterase protein YfkN precursor [Syntrophus sp. PtaU1.Bin208]
MKKIRLRILLAFVLLSLGATGFLSPVDAGEKRQIRILHVNDFHGFAEPYKPYGSEENWGGAVFLDAKIRSLRANPAVPTLLLSAGDMIQGDNWANLFQGKSVIELMNAMAFDGMVIGNHELDFGQAVLKQRIGESNFPVLAANVQGLPELKPFLVKEVGGLKVAVIGLVTERTPTSTHPANAVGLTFLSPAKTLEKYLPELRRTADVVIVLTHIGHEADLFLAQSAPGADAVIGGHSHTRVTNPPRIGNTLVLQAWEHGKALGVLDLTLEDGRVTASSARLIDVKPEGSPAEGPVAALVALYTQQMEAVLGEMVGRTLVPLNAADVRFRETNFGNLVADVVRRTAGAEVALINGGTIRRSIGKGQIRLKEIYSALPFNNYVVAFRLRGNQLRAALEHGVAGVELRDGAFPQISGMKMTYDPSAPPGRRVRTICVGGRELEPEREYIVATNDFLAAGGDGYKAFGEVISAEDLANPAAGGLPGSKLVYNDPSHWLRDLVADTIRKSHKIRPIREDRIVEISSP